MLERVGKYNVVIIGAGPAGISAALELAKSGKDVLILEKQEQVGGISKTIEYNGYHFDTGGHRFWTKNKEVENLWKNTLKEDLLTRPRQSRIFYRQKFFDYPLKPKNALRNLGIGTSAVVGASYLKSKAKKIFSKKEAENFKEWVSERFGEKLFNIFFDTYTQKVWGIPTTELGAQWAAQRIKNLSLWKAAMDMLKLSKKGSVTSLIDEFLYPRLGPGMMYEAILKEAVSLGAKIELNTEVIKLKCKNGKIESVVVKKNGNEELIRCDFLLSTMPLPELVNNLDNVAPFGIREANKKLWFRHFLTANLIVNKKDVMPDNWIYIHEPGIKAGRLQNFKNWSSAMCVDENKTNIGMEYFYTSGDEIDKMSDVDLLKLAKKELCMMGFAEENEVETANVVRSENAYPVYQIGYKEALDKVVEYVKQLKNMQIMGRGGMFRYNNMDHSILTGLIAARNLLGQKNNVFAVNSEADYLEERLDR